MPGQELFHYLDDEGNPHHIGSADVNDYLRTISGEDYTAKDFRTWSGTVLAALALQQFDSEAQAKKNDVRAIETVAEKLGNTPAICRKCYVHPAVIGAYLDGTILDARRRNRTWLKTCMRCGRKKLRYSPCCSSACKTPHRTRRSGHEPDPAQPDPVSRACQVELPT